MLGLSLGLNAGVNTRRAAAFVPTDFPNLLGWWDASDLSTITEAGGFVSQWDDKSGNNRHMTQSNASGQVQTGVDSLNGLNVFTALVGDNFGSVWVGDVNDNSTVAEGSSLFFVWRVDSGDRFVLAGSTVNAWIGAALQGSTFSIPSTRGILYRKNGIFLSEDATNAGVTAGSIFDFYAPAGWNVASVVTTENEPAISFLGRGTVGDSFSKPRKFGEVLWYEGVMTTEQRLQVETYLGNKWGIPIS